MNTRAALYVALLFAAVWQLGVGVFERDTYRVALACFVLLAAQEIRGGRAP